MLERVRTEQQASPDPIGRASHYEFSIGDVLTFARSYWPYVAVTAMIGLMCAFYYVVTTKRTYIATSQLLIETNQQPTPTLSNTDVLMSMDTPQIESQIALLLSDQIAGKVAQVLEKRQEDADQKTKGAAADAASQAEDGYFARFYNLLFGTVKPETVDEKKVRLHNMMLAIQGNMDVRRVGMSYVLNLSYRADDPQTAAFVANAIGDAYVQDKIDLRVQSARTGSAWLESRLAELRQSMNDAALDVQLFKAKRDYRLVDRQPSEQFGLSDPTDSKGAVAAPNAGKTDGKAENTEPKQTTLEELESRAETYKKIYESYLQAYMETVQRQSYPGTSARVITRADPPTRKASPKTIMSLATGLVLGAMMGIGLSLAHASLDNTVRTAKQVLRTLNIPLLGHVTRSLLLHGVPYAHLLPHPFRRTKKGIPTASFFIAENRKSQRIARELSAVAVALKQVMDAQGTRIVGILGAKEGLNASAIASNLALLNANAGWRTLLVETDTSTPNLKTVFADDSRFGLQDLVDGRATAADVLRSVTQSPGLSALLAKGTGNVWTPQQLSALKAIIQEASGQFDIVLIHLPPVGSPNRAVAIVEDVVIVGSAGRTMMSGLADIASDLRLAGKRPVGVIDSDLV